AGTKDMKLFAEQLEYRCARLEQMAFAPLDDMTKTIDELFGERVGKAQREAMAARCDRREEPGRLFAAPRSGAIATPAIVPAPQTYREVPRHNFHPMIHVGGEDEG